MGARRFNYFDDWKTEVLECPKYHWRGSFEAGAVEYHDELMRSCCPRCDSPQRLILAMVNHPTLGELEANQDRPEIRQYLEVIYAAIDKYAERFVMERNEQRKRK